MAPTSVGTVAFLPTLFPKESFRAAILTQFSTDPRRAAALPSHWITRASILTVAGEAAVPPKGAFGTGLIAYDSTPALRTVTTSLVLIACSTISAIIACQAAVMTKGVLQADKFFRKCVLSSCFHLFLLLLILLIEELGELIAQDGDVRNRAYDGALAIQGFHGVIQRNTAPPVFIQFVSNLAAALEGPHQVLARVFTLTVI